MFYVYILRCADDSLYVGSTRNLYARVQAHNNGHGAAHTYKHRPVKLVYFETFGSETDAINRERQIKNWNHAKKDALIKGDVLRLKRLSNHARRSA